MHTQRNVALWFLVHFVGSCIPWFKFFSIALPYGIVCLAQTVLSEHPLYSCIHSKSSITYIAACIVCMECGTTHWQPY